jgi:hypothetical protein
VGEGDPVGVEVGGGGGSGGQFADRVVHDEVGPDLLVDQVGQPGAQHPPGAAEVGFQLIVGGLFLPTLVVGGGQFIGSGPVVAAGLQDGGQQRDQFAGAVAGPVGHVVLDDAGQVDDRQTVLVVGVGDGVAVGQIRARAGGGEQPLTAVPRIDGLINAVR